MSSGRPPADDPMQLMRDAYAQGIERWSKSMEEIVGSEDFASASGQLLALYAQQQQSIRAASRVAAESIQMPTTEDLAEVAQLVINVERKVDEVSDQSADAVTRLTALEARIGEATAGTQTLSARLDAVEAGLAALTESATALPGLSEQLTRIEAAIGELARRPAEPPRPAASIASAEAKAPAAKTAGAKAPATKKAASKAPATKKVAAKKASASESEAPASTPPRRARPSDG